MNNFIIGLKRFFTNKNVVVSWNKPGIFDRKIEPYYYAVTNQNLTKKHRLETVLLCCSRLRQPDAEDFLIAAAAEDQHIAEHGGGGLEVRFGRGNRV